MRVWNLEHNMEHAGASGEGGLLHPSFHWRRTPCCEVLTIHPSAREVCEALEMSYSMSVDPWAKACTAVSGWKHMQRLRFEV